MSRHVPTFPLFLNEPRLQETIPQLGCVKTIQRKMGILASIISSGCLCNNFTHYILHSISHTQRRRRPRPLTVLIIIVHDGRAGAGSNGRASTMVLWIGCCGGPGGGGEAKLKLRAGMVHGVVMKRLYVGRRPWLMGGGGGGWRVQWRWERRCCCFFVLMVIF